MLDWLIDTFGWMYWTVPSALFFIAIFAGIAMIGVLDVVKPQLERKGFWPIPTSRGDRFFIGVITTIGFFLIWVGFTGQSLLLLAAVISVIWFFVQFRWG